MYILIIWIISSNFTQIYDEFRSRSFIYEIFNLVRNLIILALACIVLPFTIKDLSITRLFVFVFILQALFFLSIEKYVFRKLIEYARKNGKNTRTILIVGAGEVGKNFYDTIVSNPQFGYRLVGFLDDKKKDFLNGKYLGKISNLEKVLTENSVEDVLIALPNYAYDKILEVIKICKNYATRVKIIPDYFKFFSTKYEISRFGSFPVISIRKIPLDEIHWKALKRIFDILITILATILLFSWLFPLLIICQKIFNPGPLFYRATRWGRSGEKFHCYKFRSMVPESKNVRKDGKHNHSQKNDMRITKFGKLLRKGNLDELPQFWNVLKGDMSIVGPRPHDDQENIDIKDKIDLYMWRYMVKPGITGWAQVNGFRGGTKDLNLMQKRTDHDNWYIEHWSFWLDIQIIFMTVWNMPARILNLRILCSTRAYKSNYKIASGINNHPRGLLVSLNWKVLQKNKLLINSLSVIKKYRSKFYFAFLFLNHKTLLLLFCSKTYNTTFCVDTILKI